MSKFNTYYSAKPLLEKGSIFNMVLSERSDGKTFDCKFRAFEDFEKKGTSKLYVRRYKTEFPQAMYEQFMNEFCRVYPEKVYDYDFRCSKQGIEIKRKKCKEYNDWLIYFMPLTMAGKRKSTIDVFRIDEIDFDEYIPNDGRYCKDEMNLIFELYNSIDRERYTTKFLALGNKVDLFNPFFNCFKLNFDIEKRGIRTYKDGTLSIQIYANDEHRNERKNSPFIKLIEGTEYANYMFGGVLNTPTILTSKVDDKAQCVFAFLTSIGKGSIWYFDDKLIISNKIRNDVDYIVDDLYAIKNRQITINETSVNNVLKKFYRYGDIYFEDKNAYNSFEPILKKIK